MVDSGGVAWRDPVRKRVHQWCRVLDTHVACSTRNRVGGRRAAGVAAKFRNGRHPIFLGIPAGPCRGADRAHYGPVPHRGFGFRRCFRAVDAGDGHVSGPRRNDGGQQHQRVWAPGDRLVPTESARSGHGSPADGAAARDRGGRSGHTGIGKARPVDGAVVSRRHLRRVGRSRCLRSAGPAPPDPSRRF